MYIFYDFETSSRELVGQIMTYAFVVTDSQFNAVDMLEGAIQLRPTELPEVEAVLVNRIDVAQHQSASDLEIDAAKKIFQFLSKWVQKFGTCSLVGFNSNQFDLGFLRNLLIHYGHNPYFYGKLKNLDILHFSQHIAFQNTENFPWIKVENPDTTYYSFTMEDLSFSFGLLTGKQTHSAAEDVALLIELTKALQARFEIPLAQFSAVSWHSDELSQASYQLVKVKQRHFAKAGEELEKYRYAYYGVVGRSGKQVIVVSLDKVFQALSEDLPLDEAVLLSSMRSVNENKSFFIAEPVGDSLPDELSSVAELVFQDAFIHACSKAPEQYFQRIKKDWDIDYQIHELGFDRIDHLARLITELQADPSRYSEMVQSLWSKRKVAEDRYLVQLFNRVNLWMSPSPDPQYLKKYMEPRYVTGALLRDPETVVSIEDRLKKMKKLLSETHRTEEDKQIIESLLTYYKDRCQPLGLA